MQSRKNLVPDNQERPERSLKVAEFSEKLAGIQERIAAACAKAHRNPDEVEIVGVTKTFGPDAVRDAWENGIRVIGENRVQEAAAKIPECVSGPEWHLIGHLQKNKVRAALGLFTCFHSVDTLPLLDQIIRISEETGARPRVLLEVNVSGESSKFGLKPDAVPEVIERALSARNVTLEGFMTMAPASPDKETTRPVFARLRSLRDKWESDFGAAFPRLSMGMSGDFEVAVEEGATWVRIGTALFGDRPKWRPQICGEGEEKVFTLD